MQATASGFEQLKGKMRDGWMAGDFGQVAQYSAKGAEEFVDRLSILPGMRVLDVACGTGNLAIPAARKGATVTGLDIAPNLLEQARLRADAESLIVKFEEGDAEQLPYPDGGFDLVMSMFGAMFAPRPEKVATELMRVCKAGSQLAMANWTPEGFVGKTFALMGRYAPLPEGIPAPVLWGDEKMVRERLGAYASEIKTKRRTIIFDHPLAPPEVVQFFRRYFGPTQMTFAKLDAAGQANLAADLEKLWREQNEASGGRTMVRNEYLEVIATRA